MSDGERNATILAATVLTVEPGTVLLIDEPERHLHRAIIEPFLSALFRQREDCTFVVSTHEIALPIVNPDVSVLMVRSCEWNGDTAKSWDVAVLDPNTELPEELKRAILEPDGEFSSWKAHPVALTCHSTMLYFQVFP